MRFGEAESVFTCTGGDSSCADVGLINGFGDGNRVPELEPGVGIVRVDGERGIEDEVASPATITCSCAGSSSSLVTSIGTLLPSILVGDAYNDNQYLELVSGPATQVAYRRRI